MFKEKSYRSSRLLQPFRSVVQSYEPRNDKDSTRKVVLDTEAADDETTADKQTKAEAE